MTYESSKSCCEAFLKAASTIHKDVCPDVQVVSCSNHNMVPMLNLRKGT